MTMYRTVFFLFALMMLCGTTHCGHMHHTAHPSLPAPQPPPAAQPSSGPEISGDMIERALQRRVESRQSPGYAAKALLWEDLQQLYRYGNYKAVWVGTDAPKPAAAALIKSLCTAGAEGFHPLDYRPEEILSTLETAYSAPRPDPEELARLDLLLTYTLLDYGYDLSIGRLDPTLVAPNWHILPSRENFISVLQRSLQDGRVDEALEALRPSQPEYEGLRKALADYQAVAQEGGWPRVEEGRVLKQGDKHPRVITLRKRLAATGDLDPALAVDNPSFDKAVAEAVSGFQERHGLRVNRSLDAATVKMLNVPVEDRILQIILNMERWRWLPKELGERYILVNIPDFQLHAYDNGTEVLSMAVVVGQEFSDRATPTFSGMMESVVFSPYWNVPASIARKEILPKLKQDPDYLAKHNYEMVSGGAIRQRPGSGNALGRIKFLFPNEFSVYLHDTPKKHLFKKHTRAYSHGCIPVHKPVELAMYVFGDDPNWTEKRIHRLMHSGKSQGIRLTREVPVYILYFTAFVKNGTVHFRNDLYGQDKTMIEALRERTSNESDPQVHRLCRIWLNRGIEKDVESWNR